MKRKLLLSLIFASFSFGSLGLAQSTPVLASLIPLGAWPLCRAGVSIPGCGTAPNGSESYMVAIFEKDSRVTNFKWHLTGIREFDRVSVDITGTIERAGDTTNIQVSSGILLDGYKLEVVSRVDK